MGMITNKNKKMKKNKFQKHNNNKKKYQNQMNC